MLYLRPLRFFVVISALFASLSGCAVFQAKPGSDGAYTVAKGDTLHSIGQRFGIPPRELQRYNEISNPRELQVGQVLQIPAVGPLRSPTGRLSTSLQSGERIESSREGMQQISLSGVRSYVGAMAVPVEGARFSSPFGWRWNKFHEGADLSAPQGTKVYAAHRGTVVMATRSFYGYGRTVVIKGDGLLTVYAHNSANRVSVGDTVEKGDWIAEVGQTGSASGPHLHFETRVQDSSGRYAAVDPTVFYP